MLFYTDGQAYVFLAMLVCGALVGAWYDVLRRVRRLTMAGGVLTALLDVLFAVGALLETCGFLFLATRLDVRLYALLGAACGVTLYRFGLQPALDAVVSFLQKQLSRASLGAVSLSRKLLGMRTEDSVSPIPFSGPHLRREFPR